MKLFPIIITNLWKVVFWTERRGSGGVATAAAAAAAAAAVLISRGFLWEGDYQIATVIAEDIILL
jgi:hypothetical protein